jgi:beta-galactosidase
VAKRGGVEVARDEVATAGAPRTVRLTPDRKVITADGKSLSFVTADIVDDHGVVVPGADNLISFQVHGGKLAGLDNGRQESAENYQASARTAFNGKALAIVQSGQGAGLITITARSAGLRPAMTAVIATGPRQMNRQPMPQPAPEVPAASPAAPIADASYSGTPDTIPAAMLDGVTSSGGWSNYYAKQATALLPAISRAHASEWVSVSWPHAQRLDSIQSYFTTDTVRALPATIAVTYWDGHAFLPVRNPRIEWAAGSGQPTRLTFDPVTTSRLKLDMTSRSPGGANGFLQIAELTVNG